MIHKLQRVLGTYLHRKLFWFAAVLYGLFIIGAWNMPVRETPRLWIENQVHWLPQQTFDGVTSFTNWQANDQQLDELRSLTINGNYVETSDQIGDNGQPQRKLIDDSEVTVEFLQKLGRCVHLRELHLISFLMTPELGEALARLPSLQRLELTLNGPPIPSLANLPALTQLRYFQVPRVPLAELGLLAKHPQLKTIELQDWPSLPTDHLPEVWNKPCTLHEATQIEEVVLKPINQRTWSIFQRKPLPESPTESDAAVPFNQSLIDSVARLPKLTAVEVRDPWGGWPARTVESPQVSEALATRSDVSINPVLRSTDLLGSPFSYLATFVVLAVILIQWFDHFGASTARTVPGFTGPHLIVPAGLMSLQLFIAAGILVARQQIAWLPALAMVSAVPAIVALAVGWVTRHPRSLPLVFAGGVWALMGLVYAGNAALPMLGGEAYLLAATPQMVFKSLLLIAFEVAIMIWATVGVQRLAIQIEEAHLQPGLGLFQTMKQLQMQKTYQASSVHLERQPARRLLYGKIDRFIRLSPQLDQMSYRRRQWQAANGGHWITALIGCVIGPWLLVGVFCLTFGVLSGNYATLSSYAYYAVVAGTFSWVGHSLIVSSTQMLRRPVLEQELLRPIWRKEFNRHLLESPWIMSRFGMFASIMYLIVFVLYSYLQPPADSISQSLARLLVPHLLLVLSWPLPTLATGTLLLTVSSEFWRGVLGFGLHFSLFMFVQFTAISSLFQTSAFALWSISVLSIVSVVCVILGIGIHWICRRRLMRMEWGLTAV